MRKMISLFLTTVAFISIIPTSSAFDYHPTASLSVSETGAYSVTAYSEFSYSSDQIREINLLNDNGNYVTVEHRAIPAEAKMGVNDSNASYYTTAPNPYFDRDDDDVNGWYEESEITILGTMTAGKKYVFSTFFAKDGTVRSGRVDFNSQRSVRATPLNEYNTVPGSSKTLVCKEWSSVSRSANNGSDVGLDYSHGTMKLPTLQTAKDNTPVSCLPLDQYMANRYATYNQIFEKNHDMSMPTSGIITFAEPVSIGTLVDILNRCDCTLVNYQAKFYNIDGDWCTFGGTTLNEAAMIASADEQAALFEKPHISYEGITSAEIILTNGEDSFQALKGEVSVYFVDLAYWIDNDKICQKAPLSYAWYLDDIDQ